MEVHRVEIKHCNETHLRTIKASQESSILTLKQLLTAQGCIYGNAQHCKPGVVCHKTFSVLYLWRYGLCLACDDQPGNFELYSLARGQPFILSLIAVAKVNRS